MSHNGFSHLGLSTLDLDKTRDFYENILGFKPVRCDIIKVKEGGQIRHIFFDTGRDQLIAFMEARGVRSQRDPAGVLLLHAYPERERCPDAGPLRDLCPPAGARGQECAGVGGERTG